MSTGQENNQQNMAAPAWVAPTVSTGGQGLSSLGHDWWQGKQNEKYNEWQKQHVQDQNLWNRKQWEDQNLWRHQFWNLQNEYNHPSAQMARFKEAGLNPHLIYGKGTAGNAVNPAGAQETKAAAKGNFRSMAEGIKGFQGTIDPFNQVSQLNLMDAQRSQAEQVAEYNRQAAREKEYDAKIKEHEARKRGVYIDANIDKTNSETDKNKSQKDLFDSQTELNQQLKEFREFSFPQQLDFIKKQNTNLDVQTDKLRSDINYANAGIKKLNQDVLESQSRISKMSQEEQLLYAQTVLAELEEYLQRTGLKTAPYYVRMLTEEKNISAVEGSILGVTPQWAKPAVTGTINTIKTIMKVWKGKVPIGFK